MKIKSGKTIKMMFLECFLKFMAKTILWRHEPFVIAVTGSIGKTTTKEAIYHLVKTEYRTWTAKKNFNNEIGVPLTIIGAECGASSLSDFFQISKMWLKTLLGVIKYPKMLVLELGIDRPDDMNYLLSIVKIDIAVVNHITNVHQEFFKNIDQIAKEKGKIVEKLKKSSNGGFAILNEDDPRVKKMASRTNGGVMTYGYSDEADLYASDISQIFENNKFQGLSFKLNYEGKSIPIRLKHVLADYHIYAVLVAIAVGNVLKINMVDLAEQVNSFHPPVGRMNSLEGINSSMVIDDTYNSSPKATEAAINSLSNIPNQRKIAVLGDMLELGKDEARDHKRVVKLLSENNIEIIFLVGRRMMEAGNFFEKSENNTIVKFFDSPLEAGNELRKIVKSGDLILVKGSQGMRMEKVVERIIQDNGNVEKLLCRQDFNWKEKSYKMP
ncbi:MAG: UDP-N-acetylmuramoyl-tripeptide--D-alanyl-D-alanine ligase [Candidatus Moranbacteria bacterium]|nr:UDP-N-acetylmuramoyl-tripeptide--D-alanyl-D-alanine ligase [Candidatus Moranbacteria bacterium]